MDDNTQLERNKAVALRFKKSQGTKDMPTVEREVLAANYNRARGGSFHFAANARDQDWPHPGMYLRTSFPDRVDQIERVVADGERVGLLFRINATHTGNYFGVAATDRKLDVYECAFIRVKDGQMVEGWFMMDEAQVLRQLGTELPRRKDGKTIAPPVPAMGEEAKTLLERLLRDKSGTKEHGNKLAVLRALAHGFPDEALQAALPEMTYRIDALIAEKDEVWVRGYATGEGRGVPAVLIARVDGDSVTEKRTFWDELGLRLQLNS
jgi:predicted ester cyclase